MGATPEDIIKYRKLSSEAMENCPPYPEGKFNGRGIVMCAGGEKYFTNAYVAVRMLRHQGCNLPVEFWHLGVCEMDDKMRELVAPLDVKCMDAYEVRKQYPARRLFGWELNPYSIIHSRFEEVIFLDADNVALIDPEILFDTPQYKETGAIFWPDYGRLGRTRQIWEICNIEYRDEPEFESGQIVMDKRRCWQELNLTMHINEHSDFYYQHVHGDKETYHMAWHMLGTKYSMPSRPIHALPSVMCQHDFQDKRIFQHRNLAKWSLKGNNRRINGFLEEARCLGFLEDLRKIWDGKVKMPSPKTEQGLAADKRVKQLSNFTYIRMGHDRRPMELRSDNTIGRGSGGLEQIWYIRDGEEVPELCIVGNSITCVLRERKDGVWAGRWQNHEQMPIELVPVKVSQARRLEGSNTAQSLENKRFVYIRVGYDKRVITFGPDNQITQGKAGMESVWEVVMENGQAVLKLGPSLENPICELTLAKDGVWRGAWNKFEKMDIELVEVP